MKELDKIYDISDWRTQRMKDLENARKELEQQKDDLVSQRMFRAV